MSNWIGPAITSDTELASDELDQTQSEIFENSVDTRHYRGMICTGRRYILGSTKKAVAAGPSQGIGILWTMPPIYFARARTSRPNIPSTRTIQMAPMATA